ncbi:unnamed protein product [Rhizoctonia solani]|uniref:Uncharacterized protein n=1 Tax=Rhizoctonia solani TaxID=456999 RepID=A0A8H3AB36_9AGAM|nr:unnamed protein product [Rhizoctonia solani]
MMGNNSLSAEQLAQMQAKLNKKLGPEFISQRPGPGGGPKLTYAEGWKIINLANEVFGFNGWSSSVLSITTDYCKKEAVTDAIKRTLRNFGNVLGNCLYDKQYVSDIAKIKAPVLKLDQDTLHRRPDLAGPVPNVPPRESVPQPMNSSMRSLPATHQPGNPSPLATSTPINRTLGHQLPTPDTSLTTTPAAVLPILPAQSVRRAPQTNVPRNISPQPPRTTSPAAPATRLPNTGSTNTSVTLPAPEASSEVRAPLAPVEHASSNQAPLEVHLAGELPEDGSVYGGSEDDAFFDNILPGELDMEVSDAPAAPPRSANPQDPKPDSCSSPAVQAESSSTSDSASLYPVPQTALSVTTSNESSDESGAKRPRIRLADAIRGGAHGAGGPGSAVGQKRQRTT